jgi:hypothetical protein
MQCLETGLHQLLQRRGGTFSVKLGVYEGVQVPCGAVRHHQRGS